MAKYKNEKEVIELPTKNGKNELKLFLGGIFYLLYALVPIKPNTIVTNATAPAPYQILFLNCFPLSERCSLSIETRNAFVARTVVTKIPPIKMTRDTFAIFELSGIIKKFKVRNKDTNNLFTFYSFVKTDRARAKSFNSFLLPLKFIRSGKVAMEHNMVYVFFSCKLLVRQSKPKFNIVFEAIKSGSNTLPLWHIKTMP